MTSRIDKLLRLRFNNSIHTDTYTKSILMSKFHKYYQVSCLAEVLFNIYCCVLGKYLIITHTETRRIALYCSHNQIEDLVAAPSDSD